MYKIFAAIIIWIIATGISFIILHGLFDFIGADPLQASAIVGGIIAIIAYNSNKDE